MIKKEPNPQFLKANVQEKMFYDFAQEKGNRNNHNEFEEVKSESKNLFDFGLSDDDWNAPNKKPQTNQNFLEKENINFSNFDQQTQQKPFDKLPQSQPTLQQKKLKLQEVYTLQKNRKFHVKQQSQLEQIIKFNQSQIRSSVRPSKSSLSHQKESLATDQQQDFFSLADKQDHQEQQFSVFDQMQFNRSKVKVKRSNESEDDSSENVLSFRKQFKQVLYFQTQSLLNGEEGLQNSTQAKAKFFKMKQIPQKICAFKLGIHTISVTLISVMYGFMSSIILLVLHDFVQILLVMMELGMRHLATKEIPINNPTKNETLTQKTQHQSLLSDEINDHLPQSTIKPSPQSSNYQLTFKHRIIFHKIFKLSLYLSPMSLLGFIIFHIIQIDTFFTTNYFSFANWSSIICLLGVLGIEIACNLKLGRKIDDVVFFQERVWEDVRKLKDLGRSQTQESQREEELEDGWEQ